MDWLGIPLVLTILPFQLFWNFITIPRLQVIISKLIHPFYLEHPPTFIHNDSWNVECLFIIVRLLPLPLLMLNLPGTVILSVLIMAKHFFLILPCYTLIISTFYTKFMLLFFPVSAGNAYLLHRLPFQIHNGSHSSYNLCPLFI